MKKARECWKTREDLLNRDCQCFSLGVSLVAVVRMAKSGSLSR